MLTDGDILPGEDWELAIKKNIKSSDLILVLVSVHSINSDFIQTEELSEALIRFKEGHSRIVPIIVDPCAWNLYPIFNNLQGLPDDMRPISSWSNVHEAWTNVVGRLNEMITLISEQNINQTIETQNQSKASKEKNVSAQGDKKAHTTKPKSNNETDSLLPEMIFVKGGKLVRCFDESTGFLGLTTKIVSKEFIINDFYIGKHLITQSQWKAIMGNNPSHFQSGDNYPVENISWDDAQLFLKKLSKQTGKLFRLPTESEWEFAAKGGEKSKNYRYIGGNEPTEIGWYKDNSGGRTHEVGLKAPNELGIYAYYWTFLQIA